MSQLYTPILHIVARLETGELYPTGMGETSSFPVRPAPMGVMLHNSPNTSIPSPAQIQHFFLQFPATVSPLSPQILHGSLWNSLLNRVDWAGCCSYNSSLSLIPGGSAYLSTNKAPNVGCCLWQWPQKSRGQIDMENFQGLGSHCFRVNNSFCNLHFMVLPFWLIILESKNEGTPNWCGTMVILALNEWWPSKRGVWEVCCLAFSTFGTSSSSLWALPRGEGRSWRQGGKLNGW